MKFELNKNMFYIEGKGYVITSDEEIKENDCFLDMRDFPEIYEEDLYWTTNKENAEFANKIGKKVIGSSFLLERLPQFEIPEQEEDAKKLAEELYPIANPDNITLVGSKTLLRNVFIRGYKVAQSKGVYTEEDLRYCWNKAIESIGGTSLPEFDEVEDFIQSLKQPKKIKIKSIDLEEERVQIPCPDNKPGCLVAHFKKVWKVKNTEYE